MTVYVDDAFIPYRRMKMCHLIADTPAELLAMVNRIGVDERWLQHEGTYKEHFDVCSGKRDRAIRYGAVPISRRDLARRVAARR